MDSAWLTAIGKAEAELDGESYKAWGADTLRDAHLQGLADHRAAEANGPARRVIDMGKLYGHRRRTAHLLRALNIEVPGEQPTGGKDG